MTDELLLWDDKAASRDGLANASKYLRITSFSAAFFCALGVWEVGMESFFDKSIIGVPAIASFGASLFFSREIKFWLDRIEVWKERLARERTYDGRPF